MGICRGHTSVGRRLCPASKNGRLYLRGKHGDENKSRASLGPPAHGNALLHFLLCQLALHTARQDALDEHIFLWQGSKVAKVEPK